MKFCVLIALFLGAGLFIFILGSVLASNTPSKGEKFTITEYRKPLCDPQDFVGADPSLTPNSIALVVAGFNYQEPPYIYRDHKKLVPLQTFEDYTNLAYYYVVYAPEGLKGSRWEIHTTDAVEPTVNQGRVETSQPLPTSYVGIDDDGRYIWLI